MNQARCLQRARPTGLTNAIVRSWSHSFIVSPSLSMSLNCNFVVVLVVIVLFLLLLPRPVFGGFTVLLHRFICLVDHHLHGQRGGEDTFGANWLKMWWGRVRERKIVEKEKNTCVSSILLAMFTKHNRHTLTITRDDHLDDYWHHQQDTMMIVIMVMSKLMLSECIRMCHCLNIISISLIWSTTSMHNNHIQTNQSHNIATICSIQPQIVTSKISQITSINVFLSFCDKTSTRM